MTLSRYYHALERPVPPKTEFIRRVAGRCGVDPATVRAWILGGVRPGNDKYYDVLVDETGIPKDQLFADESN